MKKIILLLSLLIFSLSSFAQTFVPKREFRGAWIATVTNIDWPTRGASTASQKQALIDILNGLKAINVNAVMFQIRPESDALYNSSIEPWSYWLTGFQGVAPSPYYDPLQFALEETHKRGMELHAWLNPYRVERSVGNYQTASNHISRKHPEWTFTKGTLKLLDPGLPQAREYVLSVIMDIVRRYDVDGIHFDDYFYDDGMTTEDAATYASYNPTSLGLADWRRKNVNTLVKMISDSITAVKPFIKWGISPRGIWRPNYPAGITGNDNYNSIYCDAMAWLHAKSIDYINPQLYWAFGGGQDYGKLMPWWADSAGANGRHMYVGHAVYRINSGVNPFNANELPRQIRLNRTDNFCQGSVLYNTTSSLENRLGFTDSLKNTLYKYPALTPIMNWKANNAPMPPINLRIEKDLVTSAAKLVWDKSELDMDGDSSFFYILYKFTTGSPSQSEIDNNENIVDATTLKELAPKDLVASSGNLFFGVTALDRYGAESPISNIVQLLPPPVPWLVFPLNDDTQQKDTMKFVWNYAQNAFQYQLQVSDNDAFTGTLIVNSVVIDTSYVLTKLAGEKKYYWRVKASNPAGESSYSSTFNFTTGFPAAITLLEPAHASLGVSLSPTFKWAKSNVASSYRFIFASSITITPQSTMLDTVLTDTTLSLSKLVVNKNYFWRVAAKNEYGTSLWSSTFGFKTQPTVKVEDEHILPDFYELSQNYPNPFNPSTTIGFAIPLPEYVDVKIYDMLGGEVITLVSEDMSPGKYSVEWNGIDSLGKHVPSGVYFYTIRAGKYHDTKKMIFLR
ncbi:MAG: family 10 glycosylhydrolase [Ignavibacteria bacterium]|nr:family 10 glycosylhydrolase [Ignavibacteria bacterium]